MPLAPDRMRGRRLRGDRAHAGDGMGIAGPLPR
jgi:hypothetical protein